MNLRKSLYLLSINILIFSIFFFFPICVSLIFKEDFKPFLYSFALAILLGILGFAISRREKHIEISHKEAFFVVTLTWIICAFLGALPYVFSGVLSFSDAYFEAMSGFTTTGVTTITNVEVLPKGLLFWRLFSQWIGGLGIVVFVLAVLPFVTGKGVHLFKAESTELSMEKLKLKLLDTTKYLWLIYLTLTIIFFSLFKLCGLPFFDSICLTFSTVATGGFAIYNSSVGYYNNPILECIVILGMILGAINFNFYFAFFQKRIPRFWKSEEFRTYIFLLTSIAFVVFLINWLYGYGDLLKSLRVSVFHVVSIMTTTGHSIDDYEKWPKAAQYILFFCIFIGGMAGSTAGGVKIIRWLILYKTAYNEIYKLVHPRAYLKIKIDGKPVPDDILTSIWVFFFLLFVFAALGIVILGTMNIDFLTATSVVLTCLNNVGLAFGEAGPTKNCAFIPPLGKWFLSFYMLIGRLEFYTVLILFFPWFWKK